MQETRMNRRSFIQGAVAVGALGGLTLAGCTAAPKEESKEGASAEATTTSPTMWVDAVTSASIATNKYTNYSLQEIIPIINSFTAECVISTVNEDGTPNVAVFAGGTATDDGYLCFVWTDNQTKANIQRTNLAEAIFDVVALDAPEKTDRHKGARLRLEYNTDPAVLEKIRQGNDKLPESILVLKIVDVLPIG